MNRFIWWMPLACMAADAAPDRLELPGLVADRVAREVRITARATGIEPMKQAEFFLIASHSGHDYEAIAVAEALPSHIHRALEFIGMTPGRPINNRTLCFWPRGERVIAEFEWRQDGDDAGAPRRARVERTILDLRSGQPLKEDGFVFVGSETLPAESGEDRVYAADEFSPNSIVSAFNLESTVLDVPRRGAQQTLYDYQVANPEYIWTKGMPVAVVLRPEPRPGGVPRVADYDLIVMPDPGRSPPLAYTLRDPTSGARVSFGTVEDVGREIADAVDARRDAHLTIRVNDDVPAGLLAAVDRDVAVLVDRYDARIEPPPPGQLFPQAFSPNEDLRIRKGRPAQPWELHFGRTPDARPVARLVKLENTRDVITHDPIVKATEFEAGTPDALREAMDLHGPGLSVVVCFAPPSFPFGEMMRFLAPILPTHPILHVFATEDPPPRNPVLP